LTARSELPFPPFVVTRGVGHKPKAVSAMGRADGTSRDNGRPAGVTDSFQVSRHSVEPILANRRRNLFSHDDSGTAGFDKTEENWPEMTFVAFAFLGAGDRERLAGAGAGPEFALVRPSSQLSCKGPSANSCEEMALRESAQVFGSNINDAPGVDFAWRDMAGGDQVAQPLRGVRVDFVVVSARRHRNG
jgi:hypothetical protein